MLRERRQRNFSSLLAAAHGELNKYSRLMDTCRLAKSFFLHFIRQHLYVSRIDFCSGPASVVLGAEIFDMLAEIAKLINEKVCSLFAPRAFD
jgi:hypothetical protein